MLLEIWLGLEILFAFYIYCRWRQLNRVPPMASTGDPTIILRILDQVSGLQSYTVQQFFEGFFLGAPFASIYRDNVASFLRWAVGDNATAIIDEIEARYGIHFPPGYNPNISHVQMSLEPIRYAHQPLFLYLIYRLLHVMTSWYLHLNGFRRYFYQGLSYWYRGINAEPIPILFLHGISPGFFNYIPFLRRFRPDVPIILLELRPFQIGSLDFSRPTPDAVSNNIAAILNSHGHAQCDIVAHSFGTITTAWFLRRYPSMIRRMVLLDPVSILLGLPDVAYKFLYQVPQTFFHRVMQRCAARELTIAHSLFRNFNWQENIIWLDAIPTTIKLLVGVSRMDEIIPAAALIEHLNAFHHQIKKIKVLIWDSLSHFDMVSTSTAAINEIHRQME